MGIFRRADVVVDEGGKFKLLYNLGRGNRVKDLGLSEGVLSVRNNNEQDPETQPEKGKLKTWVTTDDINGSFVHFRSKGKYASMYDDNNFLAFIAKKIGEIGNSFTVEYIAPDVNEPLLVTVNGNDITVKMHTTGEPIAATLETSLSGSNNDLEFTAKETGVDGNEINIEYDAPIEDTEDIEVNISDNAIVVSLAGSNPSASAITTHGSNKDIKVESTLSGSGGNGQQVNFEQGYGGLNPFLLRRYGGTINVLFKNTATAQQIVDFSETNPPIMNDDTGLQYDSQVMHDFITFEIAPGNDGTGIPGTGQNLSLSGGGPVITSIASDVKDVIEADEDSDVLVTVTHAEGNDGSGVVTAYGPTNLSGGSDAGTIISTASEVKAAIDTHPKASELVSVIVQDDQVMFEMSQNSLSGGDDEVVMEGSVEIS